MALTKKKKLAVPGLAPTNRLEVQEIKKPGPKRKLRPKIRPTLWGGSWPLIRGLSLVAVLTAMVIALYHGDNKADAFWKLLAVLIGRR